MKFPPFGEPIYIWLLKLQEQEYFVMILPPNGWPNPTQLLVGVIDTGRKYKPAIVTKIPIDIFLIAIDSMRYFNLKLQNSLRKN